MEKEAQVGFDNLPSAIGPVPKVRQEKGPTGKESKILHDVQRFDRSGFLHGPCPQRGPPEVAVRKRSIMDARTNKLLADDAYDVGDPMSQHPSADVYREIEGAPRNLLVYIWCYSALGGSLVHNESPWCRKMAGLQPWRVD